MKWKASKPLLSVRISFKNKRLLQIVFEIFKITALLKELLSDEDLTNWPKYYP